MALVKVVEFAFNNLHFPLLLYIGHHLSLLSRGLLSLLLTKLPISFKMVHLHPHQLTLRGGAYNGSSDVRVGGYDHHFVCLAVQHFFN